MRMYDIGFKILYDIGCLVSRPAYLRMTFLYMQECFIKMMLLGNQFQEEYRYFIYAEMTSSIYRKNGTLLFLQPCN